MVNPWLDVRIVKGIIRVIADSRNPKCIQSHRHWQRASVLERIVDKLSVSSDAAELGRFKIEPHQRCQRFFHLRESRLVCTASCRVRKYMT